MAKHTEKSVNQYAAADVQDNPAFQEDLAATLAALVPQGFVEIDVGFPPYWKAGLAKGFYGRVLMRDERDPKFIRYHIENLGKPLDCQSGPVSDGVIHTIRTGGIFTIGAFAALPLDQFFGFEVAVIVVGSRKLPGNEASDNIPRDLWEFKVMVSPETEKLLASQRSEDLKFMATAQRDAQRKAIAEITRLNAAHRLNVSAPASVNGSR